MKIEKGSFSFLRDKISQLDTDLVLLISEEKVWSLYQKEFSALNLLDKDKKIIPWIGPEGDSLKSFSFYEQCVEFFLAKGIHRKAHVVALGGGAVSDFAGFVAATLLRGLAWSVIPTTLLSMVDAAIGGKVGINSASGKNLIGNFHFPENVWINQKFLPTLPFEQIQCGLGEVLKYAFLTKKVDELLERKQEMKEEWDWEQVIETCLDYKSQVVAEDPWEKNLRMFLNFGHTFGHAFERLLPLSHGAAVTLGIEFILKLFCPGDHLLLLQRFYHLHRILELPEDLQLSCLWPKIDKDLFLAHVMKDKKLKNLKTMRLILISEIGKPYIEYVDLSIITQKIMEFR